MSDIVEVCVEKIFWARAKGPVWVCGIGWGDGESVHGLVLPTLAPGLKWRVRDKKVCGVEGTVDEKMVKKLVGAVRVAMADWPGHDWSRETPLVRAVCNQSWLGADELMALLSPLPDPRWGWEWVAKDTCKGMLWSSARSDRAEEGWPMVGEWCYAPHWEPQVTRAEELIRALGLTVRRAEPIYDPGTEMALATPCPLAYAELRQDGLHPILVAPGCDAAPEGVVVVGLEDATVQMLVSTLEWLDGTANACVWHRWEPRVVVPWRGHVSPPMALEIVCAVATRVEDGVLLGEPEAVPMDPHRVKSFARLALHTRLPTFVETRERVLKRQIEVGDTVYDEARGVYAVVMRLTPGVAPNGRSRFGMTPKYGMVYGGGPMIVHAQCGRTKFTVLSSNAHLTYAGSQPRAHLPRRGARLPLGVGVGGGGEEGGHDTDAN